MKMNFKGKNTSEKINRENADAGRKSTPSPFSEFLRKKRSDEKETKNKNKDLTDLFKSSAPLKEYISSKEDKKVVLRLDKK